MTATTPPPLRSLSSETLEAVKAAGVPTPGYDRAGLAPRIVHLGVGGFHRAHLALYCDMLAHEGSDWGICGVGLLPSDARMAKVMDEQDSLYTLTAKGSGEPTSQIIGSIIDYQHLADDLDAFVALVASPTTAIVSMTITEAGYGEPATGSNTTFDRLVSGLDARRTQQTGPLTIMSCDNLPGNGDVAKAATMRAALRHSAELAAWVEAECTFPNSMVDRITPVTSDADRSFLQEQYQLVDEWPVVAEPFIQWVIEDKFANGRPKFEDAGVLFSDDVHAWELYKLRMLNATHSVLAYLGALAGFTFVDEVMADPTMANYLRQFLIAEAVPTLNEIPGHPREDYVDSVLERFANTGVRDQTARLCIDGSAKFPIFLMPTVERQLELDGPIDRSALALAAWARYLAVTPAADLSPDASGERAVSLAKAAVDNPASFLDFAEVFPATVAGHERFRAAFVAAYQAMASESVLDVVATTL